MDRHQARRFGNIAFVMFAIWSILALAVLFPIARLLDGSFPVLTAVWILVPLGATLLARDASRIGFRAVPWRLLIPTTAICTGAMLAINLMVEPWSHTYRTLVALAVSADSPDTTFAWLLRFPRAPALGAMFLYSGLITIYAEELFFRGWLLLLLTRRLGPIWAVLLQATLFTLPNLMAAIALPLMQGSLYAVIYTWLSVGIVGGWAASRTGSIWPSLISAALCNLVLVALVTQT